MQSLLDAHSRTSAGCLGLAAVAVPAPGLGPRERHVSAPRSARTLAWRMCTTVPTAYLCGIAIRTGASARWRQGRANARSAACADVPQRLKAVTQKAT